MLEEGSEQEMAGEGSKDAPVVIPSDEEVEGEDAEVIAAFSGVCYTRCANASVCTGY